MSKLPHLSQFSDDLSQQSCKKHMRDSHNKIIVLKSPDLSCVTYLSTPQMVALTVTSQNNSKNLLHLTGSAEMKNVSKFPTCQSYPALLIHINASAQQVDEPVVNIEGCNNPEGNTSSNLNV